MPEVFKKDQIIRFAHCYPAGIVYHPNFYVMFNGLLEDLFREGLDLPWENMSTAEVIIPVVNIKTDFFKPFHIGDVGQMCLWISHLGNSSITVQIEFYKGKDLHVKCEETMVCVDPDSRRSAPIPDQLREKMQKFYFEGQTTFPLN